MLSIPNPGMRGMVRRSFNQGLGFELWVATHPTFTASHQECKQPAFDRVWCVARLIKGWALNYGWRRTLLSLVLEINC